MEDLVKQIKERLIIYFEERKLKYTRHELNCIISNTDFIFSIEGRVTYIYGKPILVNPPKYVFLYAMRHVNNTSVNFLKKRQFIRRLKRKYEYPKLILEQILFKFGT